MTKRRKKSRREPRLGCALEREVACWLLGTLARVQSAGASGTSSSQDLELLKTLGVQLPPTLPDNAPGRPSVSAAVRHSWLRAKREPGPPCLASANAAIVGRMLQLSKVETALLALTTAFDAEELLARSFAQLRARNLLQIARHVAAVLGLRPREVQHALRRDGKLRSYDLVQLTRIDSTESGPLTLGMSIYTVLLRPLESEEDVLSSFLERAAEPSLTLDDYPHLRADIEILRRVLAAALKRRERGVNILLYGPPGTGKTELARALTSAIGARLDEVKLVDRDDDVRNGNERLESYALCQRILRDRRNIVLLFDEAEDAFPCQSFFEQSKSGRNKAWTNRLLEQNAIPSIWVSNAIDQIDRAFIRRFDFVLEVAEPPRSVRLRVLQKHLRGTGITEGALDRLSERQELSPGHVQRASKLLGLLSAGGHDALEPALERVLDANLRAYAGPSKRARQQSVLRYDPRLVRADVDAMQLVSGLSRTRSASLCFYGAPGTGKTQLAHYIARQLDRPLLDYRASDLISKWVGDTERAIAAMFERASAEGAVLLLDEADGLIAERSCARNAWEITQVNEMLTQMEHFDGIFICATNLLEHLDRAALRRFAIKVRFDYLSSEQSELLLRELVARCCPGGICDEAALEEVRRLRHLTPGDFAAVARRFMVLGAPVASSELLHALRQEVLLKRERGGKALGFGA